MEYKLLSKYYYANKDEYELEYSKRFNSEISVYKLPISIKANQAFIVASTEIVCLVQQIYEKNNKVTRLYNSLPPTAISSILKSSLIDEIKMSNEIENIHSSKKSIELILKSKPEGGHKKLESVVRKYEKVLMREKILITSSPDIRTLYDEMLSSEISEKNQPDGAIFRKNEVVLTDDLKTYHVGILPEEEIIKQLNCSINWLNDENVPSIIRIAGFHFLFGYIHPFYDGNGRLSRFISASLMTETLNFLIALRLSTVLNTNKNNYYKAFEYCEDPKNRGDITPFVIYFLERVLQAINLIIPELTQSTEKLKHYNTIIDTHFCGLEGQIMKIAIQNSAFSDFGLSAKEIADAILSTDGKNYSVHWVRRTINKLNKDGCVTGVRQKPIYYSANFNMLDNLSK